ncbi:flagellar export chaperone FlgN [Acutalibacter intestini]|uniref:flagellar export chaperone FlgN n=1 Tax=Acutalibacter intestini TaxID=3093659 RepID=UPI002AC8BC49|nr:flagellar export chaperone FlgN [Acutalibacter sp. M00204]
MPPYEEYLDYLEELGRVLDQLNETAKTKAAAARQGDLEKLDQCMKQEQAFSMSLRSMDQKRDRMLAEMGMSGATLSQLAQGYPPELRDRAAKTAESVQGSFDRYISASHAARTAMECILHDIEKMFPENQPLPPRNPDEPPPRMKTDIRA